jgi:drug/metabolite transporter (DMT)-like permease
MISEIRANSASYQKLSDSSLQIESVNDVTCSTLSEESGRYSNKAKAIMCMNIYTISNFLFMASSKVTMSKYSIAGLDFLIIRTVTNLLFHLTICLYSGHSLKMPSGTFWWLQIRNVGGTLRIVGIIYAIQFLPLQIFYLTYNTLPFWASIMGYIFLGEKLNLIEGIALILSFVLIAEIAFLENASTEIAQAGNLIWIGMSFGLAAAAGASLGAVATRKL